jgi:DNA-directed RNA polymerase subunit beta'
MGCYYLTATRGEMGESGEAGEGKVFSNVQEVFAAYGQKKLGVHARIDVRLPMSKKVISEVRYDTKMRVEEVARKSNALVRTTVGRVLFNDILSPKMAFYDLALSSKHLARIIADCYEQLGRRETIELLDRMKELGFRESTRSGLSFATDDLRTPVSKERILVEAEGRAEHFQKQYDRGNITERERHNNVVDLWTDATKRITEQMMQDLRDDRRKDDTGEVRPYLNPIFLMAESGARGGREQIRQLAGMRGLMAKPNGTIIETPIKANFREGLSVLEYFSSTHGARKGLADTALKTADSGYLTRKLADVAQNVVITMEDCGTTQGISKAAIYKGEEIERPLSDSIRGRVSRNTIIDPVTDDVVVEENQMISPEIARRIEKMGLDKILVRSPMTCQAKLGVCRCCYGMDLATGALVEEGMAVGIIAAQSIGEPGTQLTMRTFHIGGVVKREVGENQAKSKKEGVVRYERITDVINNKGERIALATGNGEIHIIGPKDRVMETFPVPNGAVLKVTDGEAIKPGTVLCSWDPYITPILTTQSGKVRFFEIVEGQTLRKDRDEATGAERWVIMEHKGDMHPAVKIEDDQGKIVGTFYMPEKAVLDVREGMKVTAGTLLAKLPREASGTQDITGGLPRVTEIFEARTPRDPAKMAEVDGIVELPTERKRGRRQIFVRPTDESGRPTGEAPVEHVVPPGKHLRVQNGDRVRAGDRLVSGPLVPHEILAVSGVEAVQSYLVQEVQSVYRSQRVEIDDKHIEIIVAQMLRKVQVKKVGDTDLLPGAVIDKFRFQEVNDRLKECVKLESKGDSRFDEGKVVSREHFEEEYARLHAEGKQVPAFSQPQPATATVQLLGITKAAVQSDSFISAASFQETTKVLTEAALAGKVDYLVGLKENVILGHLVPAGTGFRTHQEAEVRLSTGHEQDGSDDGQPDAAAQLETAGASDD